MEAPIENVINLFVSIGDLTMKYYATTKKLCDK